MPAAITCKHGIVGVRNCPPCRATRQHDWYVAKRLAEDPTWTLSPAPAAITCPHGIRPKRNCKECDREKARDWVKANPEKNRERASRWAKENPEKHRESSREWSKANPDKVREGNRRWVAANPDKVRAMNARWREANPDRVRDSVFLVGVRRRLQPGATFDPTVTPSAVFARLGLTCYYQCGNALIPHDGVQYRHPHYPTIDHRIPLSKGGDHTWANVVVACFGCNREKGDDTCDGCGGPITTIGESMCAKCLAKGKVNGKQRNAVCAHCRHVQRKGGYCLRCKAKGEGLWLGTDLTLRAAKALASADSWLIYDAA